MQTLAAGTTTLKDDSQTVSSCLHYPIELSSPSPLPKKNISRPLPVFPSKFTKIQNEAKLIINPNEVNKLIQFNNEKKERLYNRTEHLPLGKGKNVGNYDGLVFGVATITCIFYLYSWKCKGMFSSSCT